MSVRTCIEESRGETRVYHLLFVGGIALFIGVFENMLPRILYFKVGLPFIVVVAFLRLFTLRELLALVLVKAVVTGVLFATLFSPPFFIGLAGAVASVLVMKPLAHVSFFSLVGVSVAGAVGSNLTQLAVSVALFRLESISALVPFLLFFSLASGIVTGLLALRLEKELVREDVAADAVSSS